MNTQTSRRNFLKIAPTFLGTAAIASSTTAEAIGKLCQTTPAQTAGPFYPGESKFTWDTDLTLLPGKTKPAQGQVIYLNGDVVDEACNPIPNANVEIWQACASGRYNSTKDPNPAPIDPNFRYWGETNTDAKGTYAFKSIIPGAYPAAPGWDRPPHIHVRVSALGYKEIISQMYFAGDPLNEQDRILMSLSPAERATVIVGFKPVHAPEFGALEGHFRIALAKV